MKKIFSIIILSFLFVTSFTLYDGIYAKEDISNGIEKRLINSTTYIPLRNFCQKIDSFEISWNDKEKIATFINSRIHIEVQCKENLIIANERYIMTNMNILLISDKIYVPIRAAAKIFGLEVKWDHINKIASLHGKINYIKNGKEYYKNEDLYWLSRIINAESRGESLMGKIAVGNVVMNRVKSQNYPNNIKEVIFDKKYGVQFTPIINNSIYDEPNKDSVIAAKIVLEGFYINNEILYFVNKNKSPNSWVEINKVFVVTIGAHSFYK